MTSEEMGVPTVVTARSPHAVHIPLSQVAALGVHQAIALHSDAEGVAMMVTKLLR